jgi:hypothetical protein
MKSVSVKLGMVIFVGLSIFAYVEVWGADWKLFAGTDLYKCFYDAEDTTPSSKDIVDVWTKLEYTKKGITGIVKEFGKHYADLSYSLELWEINCAEKKDRILSITEYSTEGRILYANSVQGRLPAWKIIPKESVDESLYKTVCNKRGTFPQEGKIIKHRCPGKRHQGKFDHCG